MSEVTRFMLPDGKELFWVHHYAPICMSTIVEYDDFGRDGGPPENHVYTQYKVLGKTFRMSAGYIPELIVEIQKKVNKGWCQCDHTEPEIGFDPTIGLCRDCGLPPEYDFLKKNK